MGKALAEDSLGNDWIRVATRFRYSFSALAELQRDQGCKFVTLMRRLEASDRAMRQALDYLIGIGWAMRNPGYGHPLRPEYILTPEGLAVAGEALRIWDGLREWGEEAVALERWPLPVLVALLAGARRFAQIQKAVDGITPRALALALARLQDSGLVSRELVDGHPPTAEYAATKWGKAVVR